MPFQPMKFDNHRHHVFDGGMPPSLYFYDKKLRYFVHQLRLTPELLSVLPLSVQEETLSLADNDYIDLRADQISEIPVINEFVENWHNFGACIYQPIRVLPYEIHTGRELILMRDGLKPFSIFSNINYDNNMRQVLDRYFSPLVATGDLIFRTATLYEENDTAMYALPGEQWRFDAYLMLISIRDATGWNDELERWEGSLLGYNQSENDAWLDYRESIGEKWGHHLLWTGISRDDVDLIKWLGYRALPINSKECVYCFRFPMSMMQMNLHVDTLRDQGWDFFARFFVPRNKFESFILKGDSVDVGRHVKYEIPVDVICELNYCINGHVEIVDRDGKAVPRDGCLRQAHPD